MPAEILTPLKNLTVYEKDEIILECEFNRPNVEAIWHKDNADIKYSLGNDRYNKKLNGNTYRLTIYEAKLEDAGSYSCTVKSSKTSCELKVLDNVIKPLSDQKCTEGENVKFEIHINKDIPFESIFWYKDGIKLENGDEKGRIEIVSEGKIHSLYIKNAKLDDIGAYEVKTGNIKSNGNLKVKGNLIKFIYGSTIIIYEKYLFLELPVTFLRKLDETYNGVEKQSITLECEVNKDNVNCIWKKYGKIIENDERIKIENIGRIQKLTINDLNMQDKQTINCCAIKGRKVDEELASTSAKIIIKGIK